MKKNEMKTKRINLRITRQVRKLVLQLINSSAVS